MTVSAKIIDTCLRLSPPSGNTSMTVGARIIKLYAAIKSTENTQQLISKA